MKKFIMSIGIISVCVIVGVIAFAEMPSPDPDALWKYITQESPYTQWSFWPDHQGMQPGRAPHGPLHKVFVNDRALNSSQPPVQYGSIAVKENYGTDKALKAITVMYKVTGYNPDAGDWFWAKYSPDGKAGPSGKPEGCIGCHGTRAANDFILVHEFK
ncbi:MAG: cytochrome P460 family protein [Deltaproteobacteria bacterium]|nr:cytochrome P460 family protein [Deltaproteobacteria bacterium]